MNEDQESRRMQVKVLYSFNNNPSVFLSRSKCQYSVKIAHIPVDSTEEGEVLTLGAFDLKNCVQQITSSSPENFKLDSEDYVVYYKDITEQPDEPFVSNGNLTTLINSEKSYLVPGRICQNLSASYLFGDKSNVSPLTLEIRLKLHVTDLVPSAQQPQKSQQGQQAQQPQQMSQSQQTPQHSQSSQHSQNSQYSQQQLRSQQAPQPSHRTQLTSLASRSNDSNYANKRQKAASSAAKATRTKSLPIFTNVPSQTMFNIMTQDKLNKSSKYDNKSVQDRFKSAPFLMEKIVDKPVRRKRKSVPVSSAYLQHERAVRTRSMINAPIISSPMNEESLSDTDDTEYRGNFRRDDDIDEEEEEDGALDEEEDDFDEYPQYSPQTSKPAKLFQSLPDMEDLDSKKIHTISSSKLSHDHGLICVNDNCSTKFSINWRYFELEFNSSVQHAKVFNKKDYDGMFGPLCNACYLFLRNKGFMRPENVVKKYLQQQRYKKDLKIREDDELNINTGMNSLYALAKRKSSQFASSPLAPPSGKFLTPTHTPSSINQAIQIQNQIQSQNHTQSQNQSQNQNQNQVQNQSHNHIQTQIQNHLSVTPNYDMNEFMNQINNFGGPLTDIDPLPNDQQDSTPPMVATKCNTRVINLYEDDEESQQRNGGSSSVAAAPTSEVDDEDKENCPPIDVHDLFETMIVKSFHTGSNRSSPSEQTEWMNNLFEPSPKKQSPPKDSKTPTDGLNEKESEYKKPSTAANMPSSPPFLMNRASDDLETFLDNPHGEEGDFNISDEINELISKNNIHSSSPTPKTASRNDTLMTWNHPQNTSHKVSGSTPNSDFYSDDKPFAHTHHNKGSAN